MGKPRKAIPKKIRFEVFKRDRFTCQYCGHGAPEVVLELDHIIPVSLGGDNDIMNLTTACKPCNIGKRDRELSDNSVLLKQKKQLGDLQERKEQIKMMAKWREELLKLDDECMELIVIEIEKLCEGQFSIDKDQKTQIKKWLKKFSFNLILECIDLSAGKYLYKNQFGIFPVQRVETFFDKIPRIAYIKQLGEKDPILGKALYLKNIINSKFGLSRYYDGGVTGMLKSIIENDGYANILSLINIHRSKPYFLSDLEDMYNEFRG